VTSARSHLDIAIALFAALAWAFAVFALGTRFVSPVAGGLLGVALLVSGLGAVLSMYLRDARLEVLARGVCPRCGGSVEVDHSHRRWDAATKRWLHPSTTWDCPACAYSHGESWPCPSCPAE
jgi:ribosomal protein S27AE